MIDKLKKMIKDYKWIYITFFVSSIVISIIYALSKIAPLGNNSMLDVDFYHQYGPLLNELYDRIQSGKSLLYSFNTGGGIPFYRNFLNYLSSPFNLIMFIFKKDNIVISFSIIIALKVIFASTFMSCYLKKTFKKDNVLLVVFSILYSFSGYFCAYYWNIMWLDGMVFLPLIMLGINKIVDDDSPLFYTIFLSIMLFSNYFIAYMICIFSVLYFLAYLWYKVGFNFKLMFKKVILFICFSILAAALVAFALIPLYKSLSSISATKDLFPSFESSFKIYDYLFNHITGVNRTVFASDTLPLPNVYSGLITIIGVIVFFMNKKINKKAKFLAIVSLLFFSFCFNIKSIDFIWHAFHVPNDLPWRYSFIYVFVFIIIGYYGILRIKDVKQRNVFIAFGSLLLVILAAYKFKFDNIDFDRTIVNIITLLLYLLIYLLTKIRFKKKNLIIILLLISVTSFECIYAINYNWNIDHDINTFMSSKDTYSTLINEVEREDNDLYRIEKTDYLTLNDPAWFNYKGISTFTSMAYESVSRFQRKIGLAGNNINSYYYKYYNTPVYNTMFNIKYLMGDYIDNEYYSYIKSLNSVDLIKYNYSSSLIYGVDKKIKSYVLKEYLPFENQDEFVYKATNEENVFDSLQVSNITGGQIQDNNFFNNSNGNFAYKLENSSTSMTFKLANEKRNNVYLYIGGDKVSGYEIDGKYYSITSDEYYVVDVGVKDVGTIDIKINFENSDDSVIKFYAYTINDDVFKRFYNKINDNKLKVKNYSDTYINGTVSLNEDKVMFTTIAYDDGWTALVDGKKVDTYSIADGYLAFDIKRGNHKVELLYYPDKMRLGIGISFISFAIICIYSFFKKDKNNKKSLKI